MSPSLELAPILGLGDEHPETVWIGYGPDNLHVCWCDDGKVHGLLATLTEDDMCRFAFATPGAMGIMEVPFADALDLAKFKPLPVVCVHVLEPPFQRASLTVYVK